MKLKQCWLVTLLLLLFCQSSLAAINNTTTSSNRSIILLDPGHNPTQQGALGIKGIYEVVYNDNFVEKLAQALKKASFTVQLTRQPDQSVTLKDRAAQANNSHAALFLSIHHDSAQLSYLTKTTYQGQTAYQTTQPIGGYSIFVSTRNPQFNNSYRFAELLGKNLLSLGRAPTLHHAENIKGENRQLLDQALGVYRFDELFVLSKTDIPAVLLEVGVIVDKNDEQYISEAANQQKMITAIVNAVEKYLQ